MVEGVKILAHDESLSPLLSNLFLGKWSEENTDDDSVDDEPPLEGWEQFSSAGVSKVSFSNVEKICSSVETSKERCSEKTSLRVIHSINNGLVFLPLVIIHLFLYSI